MHESFARPGRDGYLDPAANIWRKGIVVTRRVNGAVQPGYRVAASFKGFVSVDGGFSSPYQRVRLMADYSIAALASSAPSLVPDVISQGWRRLDPAGHIATAFLVVSLRTRTGTEDPIRSEPSPGALELREPGGASLEDLARVAPQYSEELYNEFDFTDSAGLCFDPVTVSYGEKLPGRKSDDPIDFSPFIDRAEAFACWYHHMLLRLEEVASPFRPAHREWFLADDDFVTVHICFGR